MDRPTLLQYVNVAGHRLNRSYDLHQELISRVSRMLIVDLGCQTAVSDWSIQTHFLQRVSGDLVDMGKVLDTLLNQYRAADDFSYTRGSHSSSLHCGSTI